jgi:hypothetical protein
MFCRLAYTGYPFSPQDLIGETPTSPKPANKLALSLQISFTPIQSLSDIDNPKSEKKEKKSKKEKKNKKQNKEDSNIEPQESNVNPFLFDPKSLPEGNLPIPLTEAEFQSWVSGLSFALYHPLTRETAQQTLQYCAARATYDLVPEVMISTNSLLFSVQPKEFFPPEALYPQLWSAE